MHSGRPAIYDTPEQLHKKIHEYVEQKREDQKPLTISGLCLYCGFGSRQSFYDLEKREEFSYTIKAARLLIQEQYEERLMDRSPAGAIFALKNFGWTDQQFIQHGITLGNLSDNEIITRIHSLVKPE